MEEDEQKKEGTLKQTSKAAFEQTRKIAKMKMKKALMVAFKALLPYLPYILLFIAAFVVIIVVIASIVHVIKVSDGSYKKDDVNNVPYIVNGIMQESLQENKNFAIIKERK